MTQNAWFGLDVENRDWFRSTISPYCGTLSEEEFKKFPMLLEEYEDEKRLQISSEYMKFYRTYIAHTKKIFWSGNKFVFKDLNFSDTQACDFLNDKNFLEYIDLDKKVIFVEYDYLEINIFSQKKFHLGAFSSLFQREKNTRIKWRDTVYA